VKNFKIGKERLIMTQKIPTATFAFREGDLVPDDGGCPIGGEFVFKTSNDLFANKKVVVFSLPGAFTPTCSTYQLPGFEEQYNDFKAKGIDEIYCISVNDGFVMNEWARALNIKNVKVVPDGSAEFTRGMGMLVDMSAIGFAWRSRRYAAVINNGTIEHMFVEPESSAADPDPYSVSSPENVMKHL
jgi:peroxiredoxin